MTTPQGKLYLILPPKSYILLDMAPSFLRFLIYFHGTLRHISCQMSVYSLSSDTILFINNALLPFIRIPLSPSTLLCFAVIL